MMETVFYAPETGRVLLELPKVLTERLVSVISYGGLFPGGRAQVWKPGKVIGVVIPESMATEDLLRRFREEASDYVTVVDVVVA
jgi:hypothetical protein